MLRRSQGSLVAVAFLACVSVGLFLHAYVGRLAEFAVEDFRRSHGSEVARGDIVALTHRLNLLSSSEIWRCIKGSRDGVPFFLRDSGDCSEGWLIRNVRADYSHAGGLVFDFSIGPPHALVDLSFAFLTFLFFVLVIFYWLGRLEEADRARGARLMSNLALQVAHDVRSPLAALSVLERGLDGVPDEIRALSRMANQRIQQISRQLLEVGRLYRESGGKLSESDFHFEIFTTVSLAETMMAVFSEKQLSVQELGAGCLRSEIAPGTEDIQVRLQSDTFKRVLSNLLNNAIEARVEKVDILMTLSRTVTGAVISIKDNGRGIPPEVLARLGKKSITYGKKDGMGLGVSYAFQVIEYWGGHLKIRSEPGHGTLVQIELPEEA